MRFPMITPMWGDEDWDLATTGTPSGLSISEDEKNVFVSASLPGVDPKDVEVTFDRGVLWIKGEASEEKEAKKYYRKASSSFSYRVSVPGEIDTEKDPEASNKHGVITVRFTKKPQTQPKKIEVK